MISTVLKAETAYLAIFENRQIWTMKKDSLLRKIYGRKSELSDCSAWLAPYEVKILI